MPNTNSHKWHILYTGWGKIPSPLSVGHCEGRGSHRRVGLGSKGASSREVPVTTLPSRKDGVVQRAARICRRNLLFAKSLYHSGVACVPYSLPNPPSGPSTGPKIHSVVGWELQGNGKCVKKRTRRPRTSQTPENIEAVRRSVLQSPRRSAGKHTSALGISNRSVRRILHQDLHFHPYKMVVVQELTQHDWINS